MTGQTVNSIERIRALVNEMKDKDFSHAAAQAQDMLDRVQKAAFKIDGSQLDRNLSRKLTPPEQAGAYIFRSIDVLIKAGLSMEEIEARQQEMMRLAIEIRSEQVRKADEILQS